MKLYILQLIDSKFTNQDTGEIIEYSQALTLDSQNQNTSEYKGHSVNKVQTRKGLISTIDAKSLPGNFEAEVEPASRGRLRIVSLKPIQS